MADIRAALSQALESATGKAPPSKTVEVLAAQVSLETAHGSAMFNYNFGGIKGASPEGTTAHYLTHEVVDGSTETLDQGFRAYGSLQAGARDYVSVLQSRFPQAFARAASGDVDGFAHALKQSHYYTASEQEYAAGLRNAAGSSLPVAPATAAAPSFSTSEEIVRVLDAVAASSARIAAPDPQT